MGLRRIKLLSALALFSCTKDVGIVDHGSNYPKEVAGILLTKCAVSGCHNALSKDAAAGLSLESWESMFNGGRGGSAVIPYRPDFSTLCYYTNSFPEEGPSLEPKMPVGQKSLTKEEYLTLKQWIMSGAADVNGSIKFSSPRAKFYITNQLCDLVTVLDAETRLPMRYINVGTSSKTEFPVCVKVSPDRKYWYVSFLASTIIQKFDAVNDAFIGQIDLGEGVWSSFEITGDSGFGFCIDNSNPGKIAYIDLNRMSLVRYYTDPDLVYPKAACINNKTHKLYVGALNGNYISVLDFSQPSQANIKQVILDGTNSLNTLSSSDPIFLFADEASDLCYVACSNSGEVKILKMEKDSVIGSVTLNSSPTFMDLSALNKKLFITCSMDSSSFPGTIGSVKVLDTETGQIVSTINAGYQSNGICVDDQHGYVTVVNSNISSGGPHPHHAGPCAGRNGYISFIDLKTLTLVSKGKYELAVYPYAIALRK